VVAGAQHGDEDLRFPHFPRAPRHRRPTAFREEPPAGHAVLAQHRPEGIAGASRTYLECALAQQACRERCSVRYLRLPRLLSELASAHGDGRYPRLLAALLRSDPIVLDDWGTAPLGPEPCRELLEILEDRCQRHSTLVASQLPIAAWHEHLRDPTLADAILDRLVHNAYTITLKGESMRKHRKPLPTDGRPGTTETK
jgi:DNA replication protein DnaC